MAPAGIRERIWAAPLVCAALLLAPGCGDEDESSAEKATTDSPQLSSEQEPAPVARRFLAAAKVGDGEEACALMTEESVAKTAEYVQKTSEESEGPGACAVYFSAYQTSLGGALPSLRIGRVSVSGENAEAEVLCPDCNQPRLRPLLLRKESGAWLVHFDWRRGY